MRFQPLRMRRITWFMRRGQTFHTYLGRSLPPSQWHLSPSSRLATTDMGRKLGAVFLWGGELITQIMCRQFSGKDVNVSSILSPSNTMWPWQGLSPFQVSFWSIQPFGHNRHRQTDRTDRQQSDSIGWTVLQAVSKKRILSENVAIKNAIKIHQFYYTLHKTNTGARNLEIKRFLPNVIGLIW